MRRGLRALVAVVALLTAAASATRADAGAADPTTNADQGGFGCYDQVSDACTAAALAANNKARAREGLGPMTLPTNFGVLTPAEQLFVLANIDRVDRGLTPIAGLSSTLNAYAQAGADAGGDPNFPAWAREGGSNWFGAGSALAAEYFFMYDDGPGSSNVDCSAGNSSGCWGHRHNILGRWHRQILMGAAAGANGLTQLFVGVDSHDTPDVLSWSQELAYFTVGVKADRVVATSHRPSTVGVRVWASGRSMAVSASVAGSGWSLASPGCRLHAGRQCTLRVHHSHGSAPGRLTVRGPTGSVRVALRAR